MTRDFKEALRHRRTYYHITDSSPISGISSLLLPEWAMRPFSST